MILSMVDTVNLSVHTEERVGGFTGFICWKTGFNGFIGLGPQLDQLLAGSVLFQM